MKAARKFFLAILAMSLLGAAAFVGVEIAKPQEAKASVWYLINHADSEKSFYAYTGRYCTGRRDLVDPGQHQKPLVAKSWRVPPNTITYNTYGKREVGATTGSKSRCITFNWTPEIVEVKRLVDRN